VTPIPQEKPVRWISGAVKSPPFSFEARLEAGGLLGALQQGQALSLPHSRPMPRIGNRCHELRIKDGRKEWRILYRTDPDAILVLEVFQKKTRTTPNDIIDICKKRISDYDNKKRGQSHG
jgi:phage-related protein